jgi:hypothetical protein
MGICRTSAGNRWASKLSGGGAEAHCELHHAAVVSPADCICGRVSIHDTVAGNQHRVAQSSVMFCYVYLSLKSLIDRKAKLL